MALKTFTLDLDADGLALFTWDMAGTSMNVINLDVMADLETIVTRLETDEAITGAVIASGKQAFSGGADLSMLETALKTYHAGRKMDPVAATEALHSETSRLSKLLRRLETCGKPVACALSGTALGGGFELALACHYRVAADTSGAKFGLPEVKVGLLPGAGGTQRISRILSHQDALQLLMQGRELRARQAKGMGLIDDIVPANALTDVAKAWVRDCKTPTQAWDRKGFKLPGGRVWSPHGAQTFIAANAILRRETALNYPAARMILACVYEGLQVPIDTGLTIESRYFTKAIASPEAAAMIRTLFLSMQELNKGARRPKDVPDRTPKKVGVIGAGFMGCGVAYVTAAAGMETVVLDSDPEALERARAHAERQIADQIGKGRAQPEDKAALLDRLDVTDDYAALEGCDLVIEAVFEDTGIKADVTQSAEAHLSNDAVFASNTSTLPITGLAKASCRPGQFIGIHFFSPVEKMRLVEIILGNGTNDAALATALDYVRAIRKTPIVVNDARGFFTSRVVATYVREGHIMLAEGVPAPMIETAGKLAGMPVGPLALNDEVAVDLAWKILDATRKEMGEDAVDPRQMHILEEMVIKRGRLGRKNQKGFYDYTDTGEKRLWPGLSEISGAQLDPEAVDVDELKRRFLVVQALESARCVSDKVITDVREADVGAILGFGYAPHTGGPLTYIDQMGTATFVTLCKALAERLGPRFQPDVLLEEMAGAGETFYARFAPEKDKAA
ncbi:MAG: 3-hydroxyacyl-CoA dehydrogenase NAD-binding domain-containing protein [Pseudomonadota bacterium]